MENHIMASFSPVLTSLPDPSLFSFPPSSNPTFIPPPPASSIPFAPPFTIPDHIYQAALDPKVPITIAALYTITAKALNAYNKSTGKKPWAMSRTRAFRAFVVLHNIFLAVYSAWTWWGMFGALRRSMVSPFGPAGPAGFADSVCRIHGPAGLGQAVFFGEETKSWQALSLNVTLGGNGEPLRTDMGRMWNEGLAFYGWIFYLSKFYEVLDTFIILAKGKFSSTLQTYHHAGAMMCMWAGMRYMSPPIWMFVFVNSGIHAMMYTYYTLTAFSVKVPVAIKRTLTSLQITQFLVGASYAMAHSFVSYTIPILTSREESSPSAAAHAAPTATPEVLLDGLKRILFGGSSDDVVLTPQQQQQQTTTTTHAAVVPCIPNNGATFAVWLNVLYLAPLTYLFVKFFITSYLRRTSAEQARARKAVGTGTKEHGASGRRLSNVALAEKAGWDAARSVEREVYGQGGDGTAVVLEEDEEDDERRDEVAVSPSRPKVNGRAGGGKTKGRVSRNRS